MTDRARVTVLIQSHREDFLPGAIESVRAQTLPHAERQLLVNDCAQPYAGKFNDVAACAQGEFLVPLCEDDRLGRTFLADCLAVADRAGGADIILTNRRVWIDLEDPAAVREAMGLVADDEWAELGPEYGPLADVAPGVPGYYRLQLNAAPFDCGATLPMTCMIRMSFWRRLGGYDAAMPCADTELWARAALADAIVHYIPRALWTYRKHAHADVLPYLRAFNRKHFWQYGRAWDQAVEAAPHHWVVPEIPVAARDAYIAAHYPDLVGAR